jgi:hypothetical protein
MDSLQKAAPYMCMGESVLEVLFLLLYCIYKTTIDSYDYCTGLLNDLWMFNSNTTQWTDLTAVSPGRVSPSSRSYHGFTAVGGKLYLHGGSGHNGENPSIRLRDYA